MASRFGAPYREPCGGWPATRKIYPAGPYQHGRTAESHIQVHRNDTKVPDFLPADDSCFGTVGRHYAGGGIAPYPKLNSAPVGCGEPGTCPACPECGPGDGPCVAPCDAWDPLDAITGNTVDHNHYSALAGVYIDLSACRKIGFKNVQAKKTWHGAFDFSTHDPSGCFDLDLAVACDCMAESEQTTPAATKYLTLSYSTSHFLADTDDPCVSYITCTDEQTVSVDRNSGKITISGCLHTVDDTGGNVCPGSVIGIPSCGKRPAFAQALFDAAASNDPTISNRLYDFTDSLTDTSYTWDLKIRSNDNLGPMCGVANYVLERWYGSITLSDPYTAEDLKQDCYYLLAYWDLTNDAQYPWRLDEYTTVAPLVTRDEPGSPVAPGVGNACDYVDPSTCTGDVLGAPNPAGYDRHFDWRHLTYGKCRVDGTVDDVWYVKGYGAWSGQSNLGDPTDGCVPGTATQWTNNLEATYLMPGAYQFYGRAVEPNGTYQGVMLAQKWVETQVRRPSYNFARPCEGDRYALDEGELSGGALDEGQVQAASDFDADNGSTVRCVIGVAGSPKVLELNSGGTGVVTGNTCLACGVGGGADGVWTVTKIDDTHYELTTFICAAPARTDCGSGIFGRLRFPTAPAICGRIAVATATAASGTVTVTLAAPANYLRTSDAVDFTDGAGSVTDSNKTVTVIDPLHFTFSGSVPGGGYVKSHGALGYWCNDDNPKGEYIYAQWQFNYRDYQERDRVNAQYIACGSCEEAEPADMTPIRQYQADHGMLRAVSTIGFISECLTFTPCCPSVIGASPNGEVFPNGAIFDDFANFAPDDRYGARWQAAFIQHMPDLLWQPPHKPCADCSPHPKPTVCGWHEDNGTCAADSCTDDCDVDPDNPDGAYYYPQRPWVEARQGVTTINGTTPTLPAGVVIGFLTLGDLDAVTPPDGNVLPPPGVVGSTGSYPAQSVTPWGIYLRELSCVCAAGRFLADYEADGVSC